MTNIDLEVLLALSNKKDLPIKKGLTLFLNHISEFKRSETLKYYKAHSKSLIIFIEKNNINTCNQFNNEVMLNFIQFEKKLGNKNTTINKKVAFIKYMMNYLYKIQVIEKPNFVIEKLHSDEVRFKTLSNNQIIQIMNFINTLKDKYKLQFLLLLYTGVRRTELMHILICNIHSDYIRLDYTKTKKSRNIYITNEIYELIQIVCKDSKIYLFENKEHTDHEQADNIHNIFRMLYEKTGIKTSAHCLRHTFATQLFEQGADLESIRLLLGHSDYTMLKRYIHIKNKRLADLSTNLYNDFSTSGNQEPQVTTKP